MTSVSLAAKPRHVPVWQLCFIFVMALLLFVAMRWQPEAWLRNQIDQQARVSGIELRYESLQAQGLGVELKHVSIKTADLPEPVFLDTASISPAWGSLFTGVAAVNVHIGLQDQSVGAVLVWQDKHIEVNDLNAVLDVAVLQSLWKQRLPLPVDVGGSLRLTGHVQFSAVSGLPVEGQIDVAWQQARIDLPVFDKPLGDYHLILKSTGKPKPSMQGWQWSISGGTTVALTGSGQLNMAVRLPQQWMVGGKVKLQAAPEARGIASMLGNRAKVFAISGKMLNVRFQPM